MYADAEAAGVWVNSADDRAHCSFILPAVHRDGAVTVVGLDRRAQPGARVVAPRPPGRRVRRAGSGALAELLGEARARLQRAGVRSDSIDWAALLDGPLPDLVRCRRLGQRRAIVAEATND